MVKRICSLLFWVVTSAAFAAPLTVENYVRLHPLQVVMTGGNRKVFSGGGGGCSLAPGSYTNIACFNFTQSPLSTPFTVLSVATYNSVDSTTNGLVPNPSNTRGLFRDTTNTYGANQKAGIYVNTGLGGTPSVSGPCVRLTAAGNGYCFLINLGQIYGVTAGSGFGPLVSGCPGFGGGTSGDLFEIEVVGTTLTCRDVTTGSSASGTDGTYPSGGSPGALDDNSGGSNLFWITKWGGS